MVKRINILKRFISLVVVALLPFLTSCPNPNSPDDMLKQVQSDVDYSKAEEISVTIGSNGKGLVSPSGTVKVKKGIPFTITATPLPDYYFSQWVFPTDLGNNKIESDRSSVTSLIVNDPNTVIIAEFSDKPEVMYITPTGNNIDLNTQIYVYFSTEIDPGSVNSNNIKLLYKGISVPGFLTVGSNYVKITPSANLNGYDSYVVRVEPDIRGSSGLQLKGSETTSFMTGGSTDATGPSGPIFNILTKNGSYYITNNLYFWIGGLGASDTAGVSSVKFATYSSNVPGSAVIVTDNLLNTSYDPNMTFPISLPVGSPEGLYNIGAIFDDTNGNHSALSTNSLYEAFYDATKPTIASVTSPDFVNVGGTVFTATPDITLNISASDTYASGSLNPTYAVVSKMLIANASTITKGAPILNFNATPIWSLSSGGDGLRQVTVQVRDLANNASINNVSSVYLDTTPPTFSISIPGNPVAVNTSSISVNLAAADALSGSNTANLQIMRGNTDITNYAGYSAYLANPSLSLSAGEGLKTINLKVKDPVGNVTSAETTVFYDVTAPLTPTFLINNGDTTAQTINLNLSSISSTDNHSVYQMRFRNADGGGAAWSTWVNYSETYPWMSSSGYTPKTIECQIEDLAGNVSSAGTATITVTGSPPTGSVAINNGAIYSNSTSLTLNFSNVSASVTQMRFSQDNVIWTSYIPYSSTGVFPLTGADGVRTVYVDLRDGAGVSTYISDSIILDTTAPSGTITLNGGNTYTVALRAKYDLSFTDVNSGIKRYRLRINGNYQPYVTWATGPSALVQTKSGMTTENFASPYGAYKYVYIELEDNAGNVSVISSTYDYIFLEAPFVNYSTKGQSATQITSSSGILHNENTTSATYFRSISMPNNTQDPNTDTTGSIISAWSSFSGASQNPNNSTITPSSNIGELRYQWMQAYDADSGGYGPWVRDGSNVGVLGFASKVTLVYNDQIAEGIAIKDKIISIVRDGYQVSPTTGTFASMSVTALPESFIANTYNGVNTMVYGDPVIVAPKTTLISYPNRVKNIAMSNSGVLAMGYEGGQFLSTTNSNWSTWGPPGLQPLNLGSLSYISNNNASFVVLSTGITSSYYSPLGSNLMYISSPYNPPSGSSVVFYYTIPTSTYALYNLTGANNSGTGLYFYARMASNALYYAIVRQGRFLQYAPMTIPDRYYTANLHFYNLVTELGNLY